MFFSGTQSNIAADVGFASPGKGGRGTRTATGTTNSDHSGSMSGMNMGTPTASSPTSDPMTDSLKTMSGKEFEIKFMQYMIVHHQFAIQMAQLVATHTNRPEL